MILYEEALELVLKNVEASSKYEVGDLNNVLGRYLFDDVLAPFNLPRFNNSAMDGFAIKSQDTKSASQINPVSLKIVGEVKTGEKNNIRLQDKEAVMISTGSRIPDGADAVIMKEETEEQEGYIIVKREVKKGENIRFMGEDVKKGEKILNRGDKITPAVIGLLSSSGITRVKVYKSPIISFISTGSEIVKPGNKIKDFQIYDSNYYLIKSFLNSYQICIKRHYIVRDDLKKIINTLQKALSISDIVLICGGISVGNVDYVKEGLKQVGVKEIFWRVKIKPGKPIFFGKRNKKIIFGLPGNPLSSFVNTRLFVIPAIRKIMGATNYSNEQVNAILMKDWIKKGERKEFVLGNYLLSDGIYRVIPNEKQGSHFIGSLAKSNCLIVTDYGPKTYKKDEMVKIITL